MANSSPAVLPISTSQPSTTTASDATALRAFINNISETVRISLSNRRPWAELVDRSAFSKPQSFSDATVKIRKNYAYFRINYLALIACVLAISLITNPFSLIFLVALLAAWFFLYLFRPVDHPVIILGRPFSEKEVLGGLIVFTVVVIFLTNVGSVLVSALLIGVVVVCLHAAFRDPEDLFLDEQDAPAAGFLSFITAAASNGSATGVGVVPRV